MWLLQYAELHAYVGLATMGGTILLLFTGGATSCLTGKAQERMWTVHDILGYIVAILAGRFNMVNTGSTHLSLE